MKSSGVIAGSFDPFTIGHEWLVTEASRVFDELHIVVGANPAKKPLFTELERCAMVHDCLDEANVFCPFKVHILTNDLLVRFANDIGATHLARGVRNANDFTYEQDIAIANRNICPKIETVLFMTPPEFSHVSSSMVKALTVVSDYELLIARYVRPPVVEAFRKKKGN